MYSVIHPQIQWSEENHKELESNAYFKWVDAGRPTGQDRHFWNLAEQEMVSKTFYPHLEKQEEEEIIEVNFAAPGNRRRRGYTQNSYLDSGYFYCPYVPLQKTPMVLPEGKMPVYQEDTANEIFDLSQVSSAGGRYKVYDRLREKLHNLGEQIINVANSTFTE